MVTMGNVSNDIRIEKGGHGTMFFTKRKVERIEKWNDKTVA